MSAICARLTNKGKVGVQRGRETAGVPSFLPPRRAPRHSRRPQTANPPRRAPQSPALRRAQLPAEVQQKTAARQGRTACAVRIPWSAGAEKTAARQGEPACAVRVPRSAGAEKTAARQGRTACAVRVPRSAGAEKTAARQGRTRLRGSRAPVNRCRITDEIRDTTLFYYKMHPSLRQAQPPGEA